MNGAEAFVHLYDFDSLVHTQHARPYRSIDRIAQCLTTISVAVRAPGTPERRLSLLLVIGDSDHDSIALSIRQWRHIGYLAVFIYTHRL